MRFFTVICHYDANDIVTIRYVNLRYVKLRVNDIIFSIVGLSVFHETQQLF